MKLSEALERWKDQWIAFRITDDGVDPEGEVILHEADRQKFREELRSGRIRDVYITFAGRALPEGYTALF
jgi:hypothetical protein